MPDETALEQPKDPNEQKAASPREEDKPKPPLRQRTSSFVVSHRRGLIWGFLILALILIGGYFWLQYLRSYESTDDAFIDGHVNPIGSRIDGTVTAVHVENHQFVKAGQVLVDLDPRDYQTALEQAQAAYAQAQSQIRAENPNVPITQTTTQSTVSTGQAEVATAEAALTGAQKDFQARLADLARAEAQSVKAQQDVKRYQMLVSKDEIPQQQFDAAVATAKSQAASVEAAQASAEAARQATEQRRAELRQAKTRLAEATQNAPRQVAVRRADVETRRANALQAKAQLDRAHLDLSYTRIYAPVEGIVTNRSVEIGQRVAPGQELLSISQVNDLWVTANFKETELKGMHPGQAVDIHVDAFDSNYRGYVESMPGASGAVTSLLPPQNATGNFVKVVQRLPVRIRFEPGQDSQHQLRPGMSVEPTVWLNSTVSPPKRSMRGWSASER